LKTIELRLSGPWSSEFCTRISSVAPITRTGSLKLNSIGIDFRASVDLQKSSQGAIMMCYPKEESKVSNNRNTVRSFFDVTGITLLRAGIVETK
jgi:hypothetical protein